MTLSYKKMPVTFLCILKVLLYWGRGHTIINIKAMTFKNSRDLFGWVLARLSYIFSKETVYY